MTELVKDLILFMIEIGKNDAFSGKEKKAWVIQQIKSNLNYNDTFEEVILDIIDYLIARVRFRLTLAVVHIRTVIAMVMKSEQRSQ